MPAHDNKYSEAFLEQAHKSCSSHRHEIMNGNLCGCFYCLQTFLSTDIEDWIEEGNEKEETAICLKCGIDSLLSSKFPITDYIFLKEMNNRWF
jgi:hypothetical protein